MAMHDSGVSDAAMYRAEMVVYALPSLLVDKAESRIGLWAVVMTSHYLPERRIVHTTTCRTRPGAWLATRLTNLFLRRRFPEWRAYWLMNGCRCVGSRHCWCRINEMLEESAGENDE